MDDIKTRAETGRRRAVFQGAWTTTDCNTRCGDVMSMQVMGGTVQVLAASSTSTMQDEAAREKRTTTPALGSKHQSSEAS